MRKSNLFIVTIVLFIFAVSGISNPQDYSQTGEKIKYKHSPEEKAKIITDKMKTNLDLTDEQYSRILKLKTDNITYNRDLREKDLISRREIKQKREEYRNGIKNTLTDVQKKKLKNMMRKRHRMH